MAPDAEPRKGKPGCDDPINKVVLKKESKSGTIKLKKPPPKHNKPGNWRDGSVVEVVNQLDDTARETFATGRPLEDSPDLQQCKHCKKSILKTAAKAHIAQCLKLKKEKAQRKKEAREARERAKAREEEARKADEENGEDESDDDDKKGNVAGKKAGKKPEDEKKGSKKRKADGEPDKGPKAKKKKDEPKAKAPKPKEAALDANAPVEDEDDANNGPVDSDEETGAVMSALSHWHPQPLIPQPVFTPIKRQYQLSRLHEQLQLATNGGRTNIFHVVGYGAQKLPEGHPGLVEGEDAPGEPDIGALGFPASARSSNFGAATVSQRRSSVTSRG
ncbi:hypothetical protein E5D57_002298 [Metarhizium anisopliae]|nr:hypothetical protein E5D57_002298 [Metarhizium anisopliae]